MEKNQQQTMQASALLFSSASANILVVRLELVL